MEDIEIQQMEKTIQTFGKSKETLINIIKNLIVSGTKIYKIPQGKKKKTQNEKSQRWIDSQLNSAPFKTDFKLK